MSHLLLFPGLPAVVALAQRRPLRSLHPFLGLSSSLRAFHATSTHTTSPLTSPAQTFHLNQGLRYAAARRASPTGSLRRAAPRSPAFLPEPLHVGNWQNPSPCLKSQTIWSIPDCFSSHASSPGPLANPHRSVFRLGPDAAASYRAPRPLRPPD